MPPSSLYFAYGSNLSEAQMASRCPGSRLVGPGVLRGYKLAFTGKAPRWNGGGVATVVEAAGEEAPGLLFSVTPEDVASLDQFENYPTVYDRLGVTIFDPSGVAREAMTYQRLEYDPNAPGIRYFHQIWEAYRRHGLDEGRLAAAVAAGLNGKK